jgi:hypothetical protein
VNQKDFDALLKDCAPQRLCHRFGRQHALGGERHDRDALRRWLERLVSASRAQSYDHRERRLGEVKGLPHNTVVIIR